MKIVVKLTHTDENVGYCQKVFLKFITIFLAFGQST